MELILKILIISPFTIFFKVHGIAYYQYLRNQQELKNKFDRLNYKEIPQHKFILKKKNIQTIQGKFTQSLNTFQTVIKCKKDRIMLLNFLVKKLKEISGNIWLDIYYFEGVKIGHKMKVI